MPKLDRRRERQVETFIPAYPKPLEVARDIRGLLGAAPNIDGHL
jgi:hypothetical protein